MPMPAFTDRGLLPEGIHNCTLTEAEQLLCSNDHRVVIWDGLMEFLGWALDYPAPSAYLIDGSFVTNKPIPGDIDLVVDVTSCSEGERNQWFKAWFASHQEVKDNFHVDFYPFVVGHGKDFSAFFQYVRVEDALLRGLDPSVRKGILRVTQ